MLWCRDLLVALRPSLLSRLATHVIGSFSIGSASRLAPAGEKGSPYAPHRGTIGSTGRKSPCELISLLGDSSAGVVCDFVIPRFVRPGLVGIVKASPMGARYWNSGRIDSDLGRRLLGRWYDSVGMSLLGSIDPLC